MDQELAAPIDPDAAHRELLDALKRTERLGDAIEACLDDAERELEDIRRRTGTAKPSPRAPGPRPGLVEGR
jgi:hypothetical protein